jgi:hypothetical protein
MGGRRAQAVGCQPGRLGVGRADVEGLLHGDGAHRRLGHVDQPDAPALAGPLRGGADERPVEQAVAELEVGGPARGNGEDQFGDELVVRERGW